MAMTEGKTQGGTKTPSDTPRPAGSPPSQVAPGSCEDLMHREIRRARLEDDYSWSYWVDQIPYIRFPNDWCVKIIPPYMYKTVRFLIKSIHSKGDSSISVYLDCHGIAGLSNQTPHWEVYPVDGDPWRCDMDEVGALIAAIKTGLSQFKY